MKACKHALYPHTSWITIIGAYGEIHGELVRRTFRYVGNLRSWLATLPPDTRIVGHNFKFDLRQLRHHGFKDFPLDWWAFDTQLEAATSLTKIPDSFLEKYEVERKRRNKDLPKGKTHRRAEKHSLKTLAPYFLGVPPFWEDPTNHDSEEYVLKDCEYTYKLHAHLQKIIKGESLDKFCSRLMGWTKMLLDAESRGVLLDMDLLNAKASQAEIEAAERGRDLNSAWADAFVAYKKLQEDDIRDRAAQRADKAFARLKRNKTEAKRLQIRQREDLKAEKEIATIEPLNLDSPVQLTWLLRDHFGLDIHKFDEEESTGKEVLQRLAASGRRDIELFLKYRAASKLSTAFFPTYKDLCDHEGTLRTSFNPTGTRTGRLSSSGPNLQQVPGDLHSLFIARPGCSLITRDLSAIEPSIVGYYTDCPVLCELLLRGGDFHGKNAQIMFDLPCEEKDVKKLFPDERALAKTVGLALMYGAGPQRIKAAAQQQGWQWSDDKCQDIFENFKSAYIEVFNFKGAMDAGLRMNTPTTNLFGRKHTYPNKRDIHMKGFNTLIQSSASDLLLQSSFTSWKAMREACLEAYPLLWVHDEIVFEVLTKHVEVAEKLLEYHLTKHKLTTRYGDIPLRCEGKTASFWSK